MPNLRYHIISEHEDFVAIDKPSGMLSIPDRTQSEPSLKDMLMERYGKIFTVHRIDRDTSGLILFARNESMHQYLCGLFENREIQKFYTGVVLGMPAKAEGLVDAPIMEDPAHAGRMMVHRNGKPAQTGYKVLEAYPQYSLLQFELFTGRTHQIRVHMKHAGHPLAVDPMYGDGKPVLLSSIKKRYHLSKSEEAERPMIGRLALHAHTLSFALPNGEEILLEAPIPKEFKALMQQLRKISGN